MKNSVIKSAIPFQSVSQQVLYALKKMYPSKWEVPSSPLIELIKNSADIRLTQAEPGKKKLRVV